MAEVKLEDGFVLEVEEGTLDNMDLVDAMSDLLEADNPLALSRVVRLLFGAEGRKRLYAHLRAPDGRVPTEAVSQAVNAAITAMGNAGKNS